MIDHHARIALAHERTAHLAEEYRRARQLPRDPQRDGIRKIAWRVAIVVRHGVRNRPAYRH